MARRITSAQLHKHMAARSVLKGERTVDLAREFGMSKQAAHQAIQRWKQKVQEEWLDERMTWTHEELLAELKLAEMKGKSTCVSD